MIATRTLFALAVLAATHAPFAARDGSIVSRQPYAWTAWDSLARPERFVDREAFDRAASPGAPRLERVLYRSDSLVVSAYACGAGAPGGAARPALVFVRGSWRVGDIGWQLAPLMQRFASRGFVVVAPLLRGSDGAEGTDDMGGDDLRDVLHAAPLVAALGGDTSRIVLMGESRGGMMALLAAAQGFPARAVVTVGAFTDLDSMIAADTTALGPMARTIWPDWPTQRDAIATRRSAARWPERLHAPLLLLHGEADRQVSPSHAARLAEAVRRAGGVAEVRVIAGAGHTLRGHEAERDSLAAAWFRRAFAGRR